MNTGLKKASAGLFASGMLALAAVAGMANGASPMVNAAAPASAPASAGVSQAAPAEVWAPIVNVSRSGLYDNTPDIGASPLDGGVTIAWEERDASGGDNYLQEASNTSLGAAFPAAHTLEIAGYKLNGSPRVAADFTGTRHVVFWQQGGGAACDYYARILPDGTVAEEGPIPGACYGQKNVAVAVGTDGVVHALFGKDQDNIGYYRREVNGTWSILNESVPIGGNGPKNIAVGVSSQGVVMAAYVARGPSHNDVFTTTRNANGTWTPPEDISAIVLPYSFANTHVPNIARDNVGGLRIVWTQATSADESATYDDVFTREWLPGTGWAGQNITQLTANSGNSYNADISVDWSGQSHIVWQDDTGRSRSNSQVYYARGRGRTFVVYGAIFPGFGSAYTKEPAVDVNPPIAGHATGNVHVTFGAAPDPKENFYSYADIILSGPPPPTATPTASPTPCPPGVFQDVHQNDYFYQAVHDLSISGVISGYSDCTFRPYNNITRGQASKIVVRAASIVTDTTGGPHFNDVPTTNPFYANIETAYNKGIISGYADHTFRPNNNVTRGQFSKMIVLAFNLPINIAGAPHFRDVSAVNPFYREIETAYNAGLISGYTCGAAGEPCPGLYFRPNNYITRGQAAKITWGARNIVSQTPTVIPTNTAGVTETVTTSPVVTGTPSETAVVETATATVTETGTPPAAPSETPTETVTPTR